MTTAAVPAERTSCVPVPVRARAACVVGSWNDVLILRLPLTQAVRRERNSNARKLSSIFARSVAPPDAQKFSSFQDPTMRERVLLPRGLLGSIGDGGLAFVVLSPDSGDDRVLVGVLAWR